MTNEVLKLDKSKEVKDLHLSNIKSIDETNEVSKLDKLISVMLLQSLNMLSLLAIFSSQINSTKLSSCSKLYLNDISFCLLLLI